MAQLSLMWRYVSVQGGGERLHYARVRLQVVSDILKHSHLCSRIAPRTYANFRVVSDDVALIAVAAFHDVVSRRDSVKQTSGVEDGRGRWVGRLVMAGKQS